jgi:methylmalonyl-CoA mutase
MTRLQTNGGGAGVNKFTLPNDDNVDVLRIDNVAVRQSQVDKLARVRAARDEAAVAAALAALREAALGEHAPPPRNLLGACVEAARVRATLGEMSATLEDVFGRHRAGLDIVGGAYAGEYGSGAAAVEEARAAVDRFAEQAGRRPRILVAKMGQDGHDRGQKVIASGFADLGFDVDIGTLFQTPAEVAVQAMEADVHVVGVSTLAAGHRTLVPELIRELEALAVEGISTAPKVVVGGVIPAQDYQQLFDAGVISIFGPGTRITNAVIDVVSKLHPE